MVDFTLPTPFPYQMVTDKYYKKLQEIISESNIEDNPIIRIFHLK